MKCPKIRAAPCTRCCNRIDTQSIAAMYYVVEGVSILLPHPVYIWNLHDRDSGYLLATTFLEVSSNSGPTDVIKADKSFPKPMVTSKEAEVLIHNRDFKTILSVGSTNPLNIGPPL